MPPKKHVPAKKHTPAKKHAKHPEREAGKDVRRAYEHLGRVEGLAQLSGKLLTEALPTLVSLARKNLEAGNGKQAADALRAAEHLSFANLAANSDSDAKIEKRLLAEIAKEFDKLTERAHEHWDGPDEREPAVALLFASSLEGARAAFDQHKYRQALELARAAEALAHVDTVVDTRLAGKATPRLKASR